MQALRLRPGAAIALACVALLMQPSRVDARAQRSHKALSEFKRKNPCPSTDSKRGPCPGYVIDHIKALACGGADKPGNMQWQTTIDAKKK